MCFIIAGKITSVTECDSGTFFNVAWSNTREIKKGMVLIAVTQGDYNIMVDRIEQIADDIEQLTPEQIKNIQECSSATSIPDANFTERLFDFSTEDK